MTDTYKPPPFGIELARDGTTATVAILGELDISTTPELTEGLRSLEPGYATLVVDLSRCTFFASSGISVLLEESRVFSAQISDRRLAMEVAAIQALADRLISLLLTRDPLSERVHLSKLQMAFVGMAGATGGLVRWLITRATPSSAFAR